MLHDPLRHHGDLTEAERRRVGRSSDELVDFAVNVSDLGVAPSVRRALDESDVGRYPDRAMLTAREALATTLDVPVEAVLVGAGAAELLWSSVRALAERGDRMTVLGPTFTEPEAAARAFGLEVERLLAPAESTFDFDEAQLEHALARTPSRLVSLSRPCNPTGRCIPFESLARLVASAPETTFLVDESFLSLSTHHHEASRALPANALRFRSMTKDHALAGVRLGYVLGSPELLARIDAQRPPWLVSSAALAACVAATSASEFVAHVRETLLARRENLERALHGAGYRTVASTTSFLLCEVSDADELRERLLHRHGVLVRSCRSFGLPGHLRLAARPAADVERLLAALHAEDAR